MEEVVARENRLNQIESNGIKSFQKAFAIFIVGQIFLIISTFSYLSNINGVPYFITHFSYFLAISNILDIIALLLIKDLNKNFLYAYFSSLIFLIVTIVYHISMSSNTSFYVAIGRGLDWSRDFIQCIIYVYFFKGCASLFEKYNLKTGQKLAKATTYILIGLFITMEVLDYLVSVRTIQKNYVLHRIFLYSSWGFTFLIYSLAFVIVIRSGVYIKKKFKKILENNDEQGKI